MKKKMKVFMLLACMAVLVVGTSCVCFAEYTADTAVTNAVDQAAGELQANINVVAAKTVTALTAAIISAFAIVAVVLVAKGTIRGYKTVQSK